MPYSITDRLSVSLFFNDLEFPFSVASTLDSLHIVESASLRVPILTLVVKDSVGWLVATGSLADGAKLRVEISSGSGDAASVVSMLFRVCLFRETPGPLASVTVIEAESYAPAFSVGRFSEVLTGTSADVLGQIASKCGLAFQGSGTADSQTWYPANRTGAAFSQYVLNRAYAHESSVLVLALTTDLTLRLADISSMGTPVARLAQLNFDAPGSVPVVSIKPSVSPGLSGFHGYKTTTVTQDAPGSSTVSVGHQLVRTQMNEGGDPLLSGDLQASMGSSVRFLGPDTGNSHPGSGRALFQNERGRRAFSASLEAVTPVMTNLHALDVIELSASSTTEQDPSGDAWSGLHRIATKVIYVTPGQYAEKFVLVRRAVRTKLPGSLKASADSKPVSVDFVPPVSSSAEPATPDVESAAFEAVNSLSSVASSAGSAVSTVLPSAVSAVSSSMGSVPSITAALATLSGDLDALVVSKSPAITAQLAMDPTDVSGAARALVDAAKAEVSALSATQAPSIAAIASKTAPVVSATNAIAGASNLMASKLNTALSGVAEKASSLFSKVLPTEHRDSVTALGAANGSAVSGALSSAEASLSSASGAASSSASSALSLATTHTAEVASRTSAAHNQLESLMP